uniref:Dedicator of cytokinesis N-terminal domain-containing protein n=1 Tax=Plectus sambesii TaxID=2011161 RepID=A0A914WS84_9BILA
MTVAERLKGGDVTTAIVIANFSPDSQIRDSIVSTSTGRTRAIRHLPLLLGQRVEIDVTHGEWCHGRLADDKSKSGIFPLSFVSVIDVAALRSSHRSDRSNESGATTSVVNHGEASHDPFLVEEVANVLKEWWAACKTLYANQNMQSLERVTSLIEELMSARKRVLSGNVMCEELRELRTVVARHIDLGNKWLGFDMVVRNEAGYPLDVDGVSPVRAFREHLAAFNRIQQDTVRFLFNCRIFHHNS